ncbi:MAG: hypothetical protein H6R01_915 [Burkholderiaceae bacterium]|nr:hypothetical protein [Burkholderiaceae bacterium]
MIVLNTEKELTHIEKWEDVTSRVDYREDIDPRQHELESIIGRYVIPDKVRCGLSNCHTQHTRGYLVATKSGVVTNIGRDCGKVYFGVDFEELSAKFERDMTEKENRAKLDSLSFRIDDIKKQIEQLRHQEHGADWANKNISRLTGSPKDVPPIISRQLSQMIKKGEPVIRLQREATGEEIARMEAAQGKSLPRPQYIEEPIGQIEGFDALNPENNLRQLLVLDLEEHIKVFETLNVDTMSFADLKKWAKWEATIESTMERASYAVQRSRQLLTEANLRPLVRLANEPDEGAQFQKFLRQLAQP